MPLFPLRTVLFPGMPLPLRIFEDRYKTMVRELLASGREFGVILIREGQEVGGGARPHRVGTLARIEDATELPGGRFAIDTRGTRRFRLQRMLRPRPYPYGEIEIIDEPSPANTPQLQHAMETVRTTFPLYFRLALSLSDQWAQALKLPVRPHELVDFIGPWLQLRGGAEAATARAGSRPGPGCPPCRSAGRPAAPHERGSRRPSAHEIPGDRVRQLKGRREMKEDPRNADPPRAVAVVPATTAVRASARGLRATTSGSRRRPSLR
ncbi:MAG: LON peptidase substrate-binding domain-containing protein [Dehalococcoidia bacterium]|nr:LON peptidase substrate-binding domain-containing protein [Dehalococcoidia bacterium]